MTHDQFQGNTPTRVYRTVVKILLRMGGEFDASNQCEEMRLIQAELMSWAQVFCQDCRMEQQARLGRLHHQISRTFETIYKRLCNSN